MEEVKKIDKRESLKIVTDNNLIDAGDLPALSLNARKLFYIAISQCRKDDDSFYEYVTTPMELAEMWGIDNSNVYREADSITTELMKIVITVKSGEKNFEKKHLFEKCKYDDFMLSFKLHTEMTDLLLGLKKNFSQPLIWDFMKMRSPYSMALWHLFQKEMHSFKPTMIAPKVFDISLDELRKVTGCEDKFKSLSEFKRFVLDKALVEIKKNCFVKITYRNVKRGRKVIRLEFTAENMFGTIDVNNMPYRLQKRMRKAELVNKKGEGTITREELEELVELTDELAQLSLEDTVNGYPID